MNMGFKIDAVLSRWMSIVAVVCLLVTQSTLVCCQPQTNGCFNKHQVLKMQSTSLSDLTSFMQMENWRFDGVADVARSEHFGAAVSNKAVKWVRGYDSEQVYFYDNSDELNFVVLVLSDDCYKALFSEFSNSQNGVTSVVNNSLITSFSNGGIRVEFTEIAASREHVVRVFEKSQLDRYILYNSSSSFTPSRDDIDQRREDGPIGPIEVITLKDETIEEPASFAQEMPQYPGGELQMQKDIMENAPYPEMEKENNIQGKVYVQFVVEKDGTVTNVRVQRGVQGGPNLSRVAENAVKKLKRFSPAKNNGRPVRIVMTTPVNFTLK
jgi:TonB family protein